MHNDFISSLAALPLFGRQRSQGSGEAMFRRGPLAAFRCKRRRQKLWICHSRTRFCSFCGANSDTDSCTDELSVSRVSPAKREQHDLTAGTEIREFGQAVCLWGAKYCLFVCLFVLFGGEGFATFFFVEANWEETITPSGSDRGADNLCHEAFCAFLLATAERRVVGVCGGPPLPVLSHSAGRARAIKTAAEQKRGHRWQEASRSAARRPSSWTAAARLRGGLASACGARRCRLLCG